MYSFKDFLIGFDENGKKFEKYVVFNKEPTKEELDNLPTGLKYLEFEGDFNQPVDFLPAGLKDLKFGREFNQTLTNLPSSLEKLIIPNTYQGEIILPDGCVLEKN